MIPNHLSTYLPIYQAQAVHELRERMAAVEQRQAAWLGLANPNPNPNPNPNSNPNPNPNSNPNRT